MRLARHGNIDMPSTHSDTYRPQLLDSDSEAGGALTPPGDETIIPVVDNSPDQRLLQQVVNGVDRRNVGVEREEVVNRLHQLLDESGPGSDDADSLDEAIGESAADALRASATASYPQAQRAGLVLPQGFDAS